MSIFKEIVEKIKKKKGKGKGKGGRGKGGFSYKSKSKNENKETPSAPVQKDPVKEPDKPVKEPEKPKDPVKEPEKKPEKPSEMTGEDLDNMSLQTLERLYGAMKDAMNKGVREISFDKLLVPVTPRAMDVVNSRIETAHKQKSKEEPAKKDPAKKQDGGYDAGEKEYADAKAKAKAQEQAQQQSKKV